MSEAKKSRSDTQVAWGGSGSTGIGERGRMPDLARKAMCGAIVPRKKDLNAYIAGKQP